jgi:cbb3-type cytochrome oxidase maturation protein
MNVLVYLLPAAIGLGLIGLFGFLWALRSGQYSDVEGAALRVLSDDDIDPPSRAPALKPHSVSVTVSKSAGSTISSTSQSSE